MIYMIYDIIYQSKSQSIRLIHNTTSSTTTTTTSRATTSSPPPFLPFISFDNPKPSGGKHGAYNRHKQQRAGCKNCVHWVWNWEEGMNLGSGGAGRCVGLRWGMADRNW